MNPLRLILLATASGVVLWTLAGQLNHALSSWHLNVFVGGLLVSYPALRLGYREGWKVSLLLGLWCDASAPLQFGWHAVLFTGAHAIIHHMRDRFPREEQLFGLMVALITNAAFMVVLTFTLLFRHPAPLEPLPAAAIDLAASAVVITVIAYWYFAFHDRVLEIAGMSLRREQRGLR